MRFVARIGHALRSLKRPVQRFEVVIRKGQIVAFRCSRCQGECKPFEDDCPHCRDRKAR